MKHTYNIDVLKMSLNYAMGIIDFSNELEEAHKNVIAKKLLEASIKINTNLYLAQKAKRDSDFEHNINRAIKNTKETIYWLNQCINSSNYPKDTELKTLGEGLQYEILVMLNSDTVNKNLPS